MNPELLARMVAALQRGQPQTAGKPAQSRLAAAMMARRGKAGAATAPGLAALPSWGEQQHAQTFGATGNDFQGAFQDDAFQEDGFQVF